MTLTTSSGAKVETPYPLPPCENAMRVQRARAAQKEQERAKLPRWMKEN